MGRAVPRGASWTPDSMADDKDPPSTALARPMIARDLDKAGKGQLVYVGRDGEVKNPSDVRNRQVAAYVAFGGITAAGVALAASSFPLLIPFYLLLGGRFVGTVRAVRRVNEASVALSNGDATGAASSPSLSRDRVVPRPRPALADSGSRSRRARRPGRASARARPARACSPVTAPDPAPVQLLHRDQPADGARPAQGGSQRPRGARWRAARRGPQALVLDRADAPHGRGGRDPRDRARRERAA